jgi:NTP pyrophosphatase (non-canonical NTP hydrolase)
MEKSEILEMFNCKFGKDVLTRCRKLTEEYNELMEVVGRANANLTTEQFKEFTSDFIDELADINAVVFHIAGIMGLTQEYLLAHAVDKILGRDKDPNYKRKHPHVERG